MSRSYKVRMGGLPVLCGLLTAMVGYHVHGSVFWSIMDFFFFWPFAWAKWLILHQVNLTIIKSTFSFFLT